MAHPNWGTKLNHMQKLRKITDVTKNKLANIAYHQQTLPQLTAYLHACVDSISPTTWMKAIAKEWFNSWPVLTTNAIKRYLLKPPMTIMIHMHQIRKFIRPSTKVTTEQLINDEMEQELPLEPAHGNLDIKIILE